MSKDLEALKELKHWKETNNENGVVWLPLFAVEDIEKALLELKAIKEAKPSEALEMLLEAKQQRLDIYGQLLYNDKIFFEALEPTLFKAQEMEKLLKSGDLSDGYHTFNQLYYQRCVLFASLVRLNKDKSWKSFKHSDGKYCFDSNGEWFIVGIDTPIGSYTYHYEKKYWDLFECQELECGKEWDGHTEEDVTRLLSLPNEQEKVLEIIFEKNVDLRALKYYLEHNEGNALNIYNSFVDGRKNQLTQEEFKLLKKLIGKDKSE